MMKKTLILLLLLSLCGMTLAQQPRAQRAQQHEPPKIEEMVSDLSALQKKRLENVRQSSQKKIAKLNDELNTVRKTIRNLLKTDGDQSDKLFPLFEREGELKAEISKEMYRCRQQIDNILTREQLQEFRAHCAKERQQHKTPTTQRHR